LKLFEEDRQQDSKHLSDFQGELTELRRRGAELREKIDITSDGLRRLDTRMTEVLESETDRHKAQADFLDQQNRLQAERELAWKEWKNRFERLGREGGVIESKLAEWDATQRAAKRAQEAFEDVSSKFERRINEISEMQRLAEDRFRQEWVSFKADDQKRWTAFTLSLDERRKDDRTDVEKLIDRVTALDDLTQNQQDILQQSREAEEEYYQGLLAHVHELLSAYERIMGSRR
jgi:chromosome segregation ATPase